MFKKIKKEELRVPAGVEHLKDLRNFVEKIGKKHHLPSNVVNSFKLAVDEASTNIIRHAYRDTSGEILIRAIVRKTSITLSLIDQGRFFNPANVKDPDLRRYVAIGKRGGLGIFMIRKLVDNIEYYHTDEGNELRLTKKIIKKPKKKISAPGIPGSLRVRYYAYSSAILSLIILFGYIYFFVRRNSEIRNQSFKQGEAAVRVLAKNSANWIGTPSELNLNKETKVILAQNPKLLSYALVVDKDGTVKGSTNFDLFKVFRPYSGVIIEQDFGKGRYFVQLPNDEKEYMIGKPIYIVDRTASNSKRFMGRAYVFISKNYVSHLVYKKRMQDLRVALLILLFGNTGVVLLVTLIISPFKRLAVWIRKASEGNIEDEMDIDTADEIGEIAQAFNEITYKFRKSQQSLQDQERLKHEMHLAQEIQQTLLPAEFPKVRGFDIASHYESAKEVGGDYYDFVEINQDKVGVVVADVSGKGVPGSLVMTMIRTALRTEARGTTSAAETLKRVNKFIIGDIKKGMFVTVFYAILDSRTRSLTFASAGHNPMILYRPATRKSYYLNPKGFPVGISLNDGDLFNRSLEDDSIRLTKGDIVIIYTDGVTEAMNSKRELFGEERLLDTVRRYGHLSAKEFVEKLKTEIVSFTEGQIQNDDISLVVIKENMTQEEEYEERAREVYYQVLNHVSATQACKDVNLPFNTFKKYQTIFEEVGIENFRSDYETAAVEARHLSIEEQTKIFDVIKKHPEYGAKRISEMLEKEEYGNAVLTENRVYNELVRLKLNTRQLRESFIARNKQKRKIKPPGTPLLTLDGRVIIEDSRAKLFAPILVKTEPGKEVPESAKEEGVLSGEVEEIISGLDIEPDKEKNAPAEDVKSKPAKKKREEKSILEKDIEEIVLSDPIDVFDKNQGTEEIVETSGAEEDQDNLLTIDGIEVFEREAGPAAEEENEVEDVSDKDGEISLEKLFDSLTMKTEKEKETDNGLEEGMDLLEYSILEEDHLLDVQEEAEPHSDESEKEESVSPLDAYLEEISENRVSEKADKDSRNEPEVEIPPEKIFDQLSVRVEEEKEEPLENNVHKIDDFVDDLIIGDEEIEHALEEDNQSNKPAKQDVFREAPENELHKVKELLLTGLRFYLDKDYKKAIAVFEKIIKGNPDHFEAHYNLGNAYFRTKDFKKAEKEYLKVIEIDPSFTDAHDNLGVIYANRKDFKKAIQIWKKILELHPEREDVKKNIEKALKLSKKLKKAKQKVIPKPQ